MQSTMNWRSETLNELPFCNKLFVAQYSAVTIFTVCALRDVLSPDQSHRCFSLCQSKTMRPYFHIAVHFKFSDLPETVWEIPTHPTLLGSVLALCKLRYSIYCIPKKSSCYVKGSLPILIVLKCYSYPAQCCWTWAVFLLIQTFHNCYC